ncbi:MAG: sigma-70 family RNA polymerase sigma factor, partial [Lachnospiraceae bacterium]|nr:sigma-70 family RNA polymerase sigma factor [Lachnospiraceae bacterium]
EALDTLEEKYRVIVVLYYSQGFSTKEIAHILKISDNTVRTRLSRARNQLKKYYEEQSV